MLLLSFKFCRAGSYPEEFPRSSDTPAAGGKQRAHRFSTNATSGDHDESQELRNDPGPVAPAIGSSFVTTELLTLVTACSGLNRGQSEPE